MDNEIVWGEVQAYETGSPYSSLVAVIPKPLRTELGLEKGAKFHVKTMGENPEEIILEIKRKEADESG